MEPDRYMDEALLGRLIDNKTLRSISTTSRKAGYRAHLRTALTEYLDADVNITDYIQRHLKDENIAYRIYLETDIRLPDGTEYIDMANIIGTTSEKFAIEFYDSVGEFTDYVKLKNYLDNNNVFSLNIGYANLYNMTLEDKEEIIEEDEIPVAYKQELKQVILAMLDEEYDTNQNINELYCWLYFNCINIELDVEYNINILHDTASKEVFETETKKLYQLLRKSLDDMLE